MEYEERIFTNIIKYLYSNKENIKDIIKNLAGELDIFEDRIVYQGYTIPLDKQRKKLVKQLLKR